MIKERAFVVLFLSATFLAAAAEFPAKVSEGRREDLFSLLVGTLSAHCRPSLWRREP